MKKTLSLLLALLLLAALLTACAVKAPASPATELPQESNQETAPAPAATGGRMYILYNNTEDALGDTFADLKDSLGEEAAPAQEILPCDGSDLFKDTMHYYQGLSITENIDGIIKEIDVSDLYGDVANASLMGQVVVGDTQAKALEVLGEPDNFPLAEDDFSLTYQPDNQYVMVYLDPDNNKETVSGISMMLVEP